MEIVVALICFIAFPFAPMIVIGAVSGGLLWGPVGVLILGFVGFILHHAEIYHIGDKS